MAKKYKIEATESQVLAVINVCEDLKSMIGSSDDHTDKVWAKNIRLVEKMLKNNKISSC